MDMFDLFDIAKALEELRMGHREPGVLLGFERGKHRDWVVREDPALLSFDPCW